MPNPYDSKRPLPTPEPQSGQATVETGPLRFVIHHHRATHEHYDLRLEVNGTLKSWALPKAPSYDPTVKRFAVLVEDHPLAYADFEGVIPKPAYGGGEMTLWDEGFYTPDEGGTSWHNKERANERVLKEIEAGKLSFTLRGSKMKGSWALVKTKEGWLMLKHRDAWSEQHGVSDGWIADPKSVRSGRTHDDLAHGVLTHVRDLSKVSGAQIAALPERLSPMLPEEAASPFDDPAWQFEVKLDGIRILATGENGKVKMITRGGNDVASQFPSLAYQLGNIPFKSWVIDGELTRVGADGKPSFTDLMGRFLERKSSRWIEEGSPIEICIFDLLYLDGYSLVDVPLVDRQAILRELNFRSPDVRLIDSFPSLGKAVFEHAVKLGFEGVMAKRLDSKYKYGQRVGHWLKVKAMQSGEFLVGGWSKGDGARSATFGSLLLGQRQADGTLLYVGSVGSGFNDELLNALAPVVKSLKREGNPFSNPIDDRPKDYEFCDPLFWVEVKYQEIGSGGHLRFPVFMRLRPDLEAHHDPNAASPQTGELPPVWVAEPVDSAPEKAHGSVFEQLESIKKDGKVVVDGHSIAVTNLNKVLWPAEGGFAEVTKKDLLSYYAKIAPLMLPSLADRPISWVRFPEGIHGQSWFQKHWEQTPQPFLTEFDVWSSHNDRAVRFVSVNNLATLIWLGQLGTVEIHPWYSRTTSDGEPGDFATSEVSLDQSILNFPDYMVFDLDPYIYAGSESKGEEPALNLDAFKKAVEIAFSLRELVKSLGLDCWVKTTGKTGLHLFVPIVRNLDFDTVRALSLTFGQQMVRLHPQTVTLDWAVGNRTGKIFFDYNQNVRGKTLASVFSPRPAPGAPVSWPVSWEELAGLYPTDYRIGTLDTILASGWRNPWDELLASPFDLRSLLGR